MNDKIKRSKGSGRMPRWGAALLGLLLAAGAAGCDSIFDVDNPNELVQEDLEKPSSAVALVNGAQATVARGVADLLLAASIPTDELVWVGSYDAGRELDQGFLTNPVNEFSNAEAWPFVTEARFMADEAIRLLEEFDAEGTLNDRSQLARAYLYSGVIYVTVADLFDNFVISNRRDAAPPIGEADMIQLYDQAIQKLDTGLEIARATESTGLEADIIAMGARAKFARAVWEKLNPSGSIPADPLVNAPGAVEDARAALAMVDPDYKLQFEYGPTTISNQLASWINSRQEFRFDTTYAVPNTSGTKVVAARLEDPIDNVPDPVLQETLTEFGAFSETTQLYPPLTIVSARELRLIIAEVALATGDEAEAVAQINAVRALDGLSPYAGQIPLMELLVHERRVNLFLQGRRLADMYRFGIQDARWLDASDAVTMPGTFFPIVDEELKSNCFLTNPPTCGG